METREIISLILCAVVIPLLILIMRGFLKRLKRLEEERWGKKATAKEDKEGDEK